MTKTYAYMRTLFVNGGLLVLMNEEGQIFNILEVKELGKAQWLADRFKLRGSELIWFDNPDDEFITNLKTKYEMTYFCEYEGRV